MHEASPFLVSGALDGEHELVHYLNVVFLLPGMTGSRSHIVGLRRWIRRRFGRDIDSTTASRAGEQSEALAIRLLRTRPSVSDRPRLHVDDYRLLVGASPAPTSEQIEAFAVHVSGAKSWYKHLPLWPPGRPFHFFIHPCAGMDKVLDPDGRAIYVIRTEGSTPFHHTWMTTDDYRSRYQRLVFACESGTELLPTVSVTMQDGTEITGVLDNNPRRATIHLTETNEVQIPSEVLSAGTIELTGVVHPEAARPWVWLRHLKPGMQAIPWPEDSGGRDTGGRIIDRCKSIAAEVQRSGSPEPKGKLDEIDEELERLLEPERKRLRSGMISAIERVVDLVYDKKT